MFSLCIHPWAYELQDVPQALALQMQAILSLLFQNLKFHNELFDVRKNVSLTHSIISGPRGDLMPGSKARERSTSLRSVSSRSSRRDYSDGGIQAGSGFWPNPHHCLRCGHLPNSCGKSRILYYFPCLLGRNRSTHRHHAGPGKSWLSRQAGLHCPKLSTRWPQ